MQKESVLQTSCVKWFRYQYPHLIIYAVPNGGSRNIREAQRLKTEGVLAGVADLVIMFPQGKSLYIEMKIKGNKQTDNQKEFQKIAETLGHTYTVCYSFDEFKEIIEKEIKKIIYNNHC